MAAGNHAMTAELVSFDRAHIWKFGSSSARPRNLIAETFRTHMAGDTTVAGVVAKGRGKGIYVLSVLCSYCTSKMTTPATSLCSS